MISKIGVLVQMPVIAFRASLLRRNAFNHLKSISVQPSQFCSFQPPESNPIQQILNKIQTGLTDSIKSEVNAVFVFEIDDQKYLIDSSASRPVKVQLLKDGPPDSIKIDATLIADEQSFVKMASGKLDPTQAFMAGKLKVKGNMGTALKAKKLFAVTT